MRIEKAIVLSTAHLTDDCLVDLNSAKERELGPSVYCDRVPYGYLLTIYRPDTEDDTPYLHKCLEDIAKLAIKEKAMFVRIDCDEETILELPTY